MKKLFFVQMWRDVRVQEKHYILAEDEEDALLEASYVDPKIEGDAVADYETTDFEPIEVEEMDGDDRRL